MDEPCVRVYLLLVVPERLTCLQAALDQDPALGNLHILLCRPLAPNAAWDSLCMGGLLSTIIDDLRCGAHAHAYYAEGELDLLGAVRLLPAQPALPVVKELQHSIISFYRLKCQRKQSARSCVLCFLILPLLIFVHLDGAGGYLVGDSLVCSPSQVTYPQVPKCAILTNSPSFSLRVNWPPVYRAMASFDNFMRPSGSRAISTCTQLHAF